MTTELREVIAALNRLIETAKDGEQGFLPSSGSSSSATRDSGDSLPPSAVTGPDEEPIIPTSGSASSAAPPEGTHLAGPVAGRAWWSPGWYHPPKGG